MPTSSFTDRAMSLRRQTFLRVAPAAIIALVTIWALVALAAREQQRFILEETVDQRLRAEAEMLALALDGVADSARNAAQNSITVGALIGQDLERVVRPFLSSFAIAGAQQQRAAIVDFQGEPILDLAPNDDWIDRSRRTDWLDAALNGEETFTIIDEHLHITAPIRLGPTPDGALVIEAPLTQLVAKTMRDAQEEGRREISFEIFDGVERDTLTLHQKTRGVVAGEIVKSVVGMPGIGIKLELELQLPSFAADSVQQFLAMVFLFLILVVILAAFTSALLVSRPVADLINEIETRGVGIDVPDQSAPQEIRVLAGKFAQAGREIQEALRQEKEFSAQQRQFVSLVSHELRTPLTIIDGAAGALERRRARMDDEKIGGKLEMIRRAVRRLVRLMDSTLTASKLEAGTISITRDAFDMRRLLSEIVSERAAMVPHANIAIDVEALPQTVFVDDRLMYSVFDNMVSNAIKYGGDAPQVVVRGWREDDAFAVSVSDTGVGIPEDEIKWIGDRFFRASTSKGVDGSGIGLSLVRKVAELHGGGLSIASTVGEGSTFTIRMAH